MKLSDKIRILRKARGLSQEQLGYSLSRVNKDGISRQTVSDWENGKFEPKLENIRDLAVVLNVSFDALLDESIDLEDDKVLYSVLNKVSNKEKRASINNSFSYSISAYEFDKRALIRVILAFVFDAIAVAGIVLFVLGLIGQDFGFITWLGMVLGISCFGAGLGLTIGLPRSIKSVIHGKSYTSFGTLTNEYLHISTYKSVSNSIYIPLEKIEKMELGEKATKIHGPVEITIKERNKPLTLIDIKEPFKLVEIFNSLDSYIENPDEIKIL